MTSPVARSHRPRRPRGRPPDAGRSIAGAAVTQTGRRGRSGSAARLLPHAAPTPSSPSGCIGRPVASDSRTTPRLAFHRHPVLAARDRPLRVDHHDLAAIAARRPPARAPRCRAHPRRTGICRSPGRRPLQQRRPEELLLRQETRSPPGAEHRVRVRDRVQVRRVVARDQTGPGPRDVLEPLEVEREVRAGQREHGPSRGREPRLGQGSALRPVQGRSSITWWRLPRSMAP